MLLLGKDRVNETIRGNLQAPFRLAPLQTWGEKFRAKLIQVKLSSTVVCNHLL